MMVRPALPVKLWRGFLTPYGSTDIFQLGMLDRLFQLIIQFDSLTGHPRQCH